MALRRVRFAMIAAVPCLLALIVAGMLLGDVSAPQRHGQMDARTLAERILKTEGVRAGLWVHVGCGDGKLAAELGREGKSLVHGLCSDRADVERARRYVESLGIYGRVSVDHTPLSPLPYSGNIVNLLVADDLGDLLERGLTVAQILRVLCPNGIALLRPGDGLSEATLKRQLARAGIEDLETVALDGPWLKIVKPRPTEMDEWPQYRHDPTRAAISTDELVGPPTSVRWIAGGRWISEEMRYNGATFVFADGRVYYMISNDTKREDAPPRERIIARDAYNGLKLWERETTDVFPLHLSLYKLVAADDRLYAIIEKDGPIVALDGATGEVVMTYETARRPFTYYKGMLICGQGAREAWDANTGERLWEGAVGGYSPCIIADDRIFLHSYDKDIACLDVKTGELLWRAPAKPGKLLCYRDGLLFASGGKGPGRGVNHAYSAEDGRHLWSFEYPLAGHGGRPDIFFLAGLAWVHTGNPQRAAQEEAWLGIDPKTGKVARRIDYGKKIKHRCYYDRATEKYILCGGMDFFDFAAGKHYAFHGGRGICGYGYVPANGLVYQGPTLCLCFDQLRGFIAYAADPPVPAALRARAGERLEKGPAYGAVPASASSPDWPTLRHDPVRSGSTTAAVPADLDVSWEAKLGGRAPSPVVANGKAVACAIDEHRVLALDARTGKTVWQYTAGGRVDSPPTVHAGLVLFGCRDGWVYCLRESDGELMWRFRAAPADRRMVAREQLESVWPVHGSVLVEGGGVYFAAGRHSEVDGGIFLQALEPRTGKLLWERRVVRERPFEQTTRGEIGNALNDVLTSDGKAIYMYARPFDPKTGEPLAEVPGPVLWAGACGFLEDVARPPYTWKHERRHWVYRTEYGAQKVVRGIATATSLAIGEKSAFRFVNDTSEIFGVNVDARGRGDKRWTAKAPEGSRPKAILLAGQTLFLAAMPDEDDTTTGVVWAYSAANGEKLGQVDLPGAPSFDGMAATEAHLYVATQNGGIVCLSGN
ncbi:MAG: PQQ-binding-like beta-propeller repeat protein [Armatimonadota bacterium]